MMENIGRDESRLLLLIDEPHNLFADKFSARKFAAKISCLNDRERLSLTLLMTADSIGSVDNLFGEDFVTLFDNHLVLKNVRQEFYAPVVQDEMIQPKVVVPIIKSRLKASLHFSFDEAYKELR